MNTVAFREKLNKYITKPGCASKELAAASGLSGDLISRHRTGEQKPKNGSEHVNKLSPFYF